MGSFFNFDFDKVGEETGVVVEGVDAAADLELDNGELLPIGKSYSDAAKKSILRYMRR